MVIGVDDLLFPVVAGAVTGGMNLLGGQQQNAANQAMSLQQMDFQKSQQLEQEKFQERMSSTAYQRATADMRAAGINPMVAYQQGGASSPSGSAMSGSSSSMSNVLGPAGSAAISTALQARQLDKTIEQIDSQINSNDAAANAANSQADLNDAMARVQNANEELTRYNARLAKSRLPRAEEEATFSGSYMQGLMDTLIHTLNPLQPGAAELLK